MGKVRRGHGGSANGIPWRWSQHRSLTMHALVAIPTRTLLSASESVVPPSPTIVRAYAQAIHPRLYSRSTSEANRCLHARDRPRCTQSALAESALTTTTVVAAALCMGHTAKAPIRMWTPCGGTPKRFLGRRQCMRTRGTGSAHLVGAGFDVGAMTKDDRACLLGPPLRATLGVLSPERRCKRRMTPGWLSEHAAVQCVHCASADWKSPPPLRGT